MKRITVIDSLRGTFIVAMALEHLGGPLGDAVYGRFGYFAAAEGFFFLSGFVATQVACGKPSPAAWFRRRSLMVWKWHIISVLMFAALAAILPHFGWKPQPGLDGSQGWLREVVAAMLGLHLPDYLDVLPLYVVLLFTGSIAIPLAQRLAPRRPAVPLFAVSFAVWLVAQTGLWPLLRGAILPGGTIPGLFDPLAWQFMFFTGASFGLLLKFRPGSLPALSPAVLALLGAVAVGFLALRNNWLPWPDMGEKQFWTSKNHLALLRLVSWGSVALLVAHVARKWPDLLDWRATRFIGQHSLVVYSFHVALVYVWDHRPATGPLVVQLTMPIVLLLPLYLAAYIHSLAPPVTRPRVSAPAGDP